METSTGQSVKLTIVEVSHLSKDALHIYVGLGVFVVTALVFRKRIQSSLVPLLAVLLVASLGEIVDMHDDIKTLGYWRWAASLHDGSLDSSAHLLVPNRPNHAMQRTAGRSDT